MTPAKIYMSLLSAMVFAACSPAERADRADEETRPDSTEVGELRLLVEIGRGSANVNHVFGRVADAVLTSQGIVVLDSQAQDVRLFTVSGAFARQITRKGDGPGEIQRADFLARTARDEIVVVESTDGVAHVFDPEGAFRRTLQVRARVADPLVVDSGGVAYFRLEDETRSESDGGVGRVSRMRSARAADHASPLFVRVVTGSELAATRRGTVRMHLSGELIDSVVPLYEDPLSLFLPVGSGRVHISYDYQPFAWSRWTTTGALVAGRTDHATLHWRPTDEDPGSTKIRLDSAVIAVPREEREAIRTSLQSLGDGALGRARPSWWHEKPQYRRVILTRGGGVWLERHVPSERSESATAGDFGWREPRTRFAVIDAHGELRGDVYGPARIRLLHVYGDQVLVRAVDELGVQSVQLFGVEWEPSEAAHQAGGA